MTEIVHLLPSLPVTVPAATINLGGLIPQVLVNNSGGNNITAIEEYANKVLANTAVGTPLGIVVNLTSGPTETPLIYVLTAGKTISIINPVGDLLVGSFALPNTPVGMATDGMYIYVSDTLGSITVVDLHPNNLTNTITTTLVTTTNVSTAPLGLIWATEGGTGYVYTTNTAFCAVEGAVILPWSFNGTVLTPADPIAVPGPISVISSPSNSDTPVGSCPTSLFTYGVVDDTSENPQGPQIATVFGNYPAVVDMCMSADGTQLFVAFDQYIVIMNTTTGAEIQRIDLNVLIPGDNQPFFQQQSIGIDNSEFFPDLEWGSYVGKYIDLSPDGNYVYAITDQAYVICISRALEISFIQLTGSLNDGLMGTPVGLMYSPDSAYVWVLVSIYQGTTGLYQIATGSNALVSSTTLNAEVFGLGLVPCGMAITPDGSTIAVCWEATGSEDALWFINTTTLDITTGPNGGVYVAFSPDGSTCYTNTTFGNCINICDVATNTQTGKIFGAGSAFDDNAPLWGPMAFIPGTTTMVIPGNWQSGYPVAALGTPGNYIELIDTVSNTVSADILVSEGAPQPSFYRPAFGVQPQTNIISSEPVRMAISPDGQTIYAVNYGTVLYSEGPGVATLLPNYGAPILNIVSVASQQVTATIPFAGATNYASVSCPIVLDPAGEFLYVADIPPNTITKVNAKTGAWVATWGGWNVPGGVDTWGVGVSEVNGDDFGGPPLPYEPPYTLGGFLTSNPGAVDSDPVFGYDIYAWVTSAEGFYWIVETGLNQVSLWVDSAIGYPFYELFSGTQVATFPGQNTSAGPYFNVEPGVGTKLITLTTGVMPWDVKVTRDGWMMYVTNKTDKTVWVYDLALITTTGLVTPTPVFLVSVPVGTSPTTMAVL